VAGDWIKLQHSTPDKPEVMKMAKMLAMEPEQVAGHLIRVWSWTDQQSLDGHALDVTESDVDRVARHAGVAKAMREVGWLSGQDGRISFPNFDRHNGESAKKRALAADRQRVKRSRSNRDINVTREEERREEEVSSSLRSEAPGLQVVPSKSIEPLKAEISTSACWSSYGSAYKKRYGVEPVRNAKVNSLLKQFVQRIGMDESPEVAAFYVGHDRAIYVQARHDVSLMVRDCEGLRTQWATGRKATALEARSAESREAVRSQAERVVERMEAGHEKDR
jgi:hypothetical protein